MALGRDKDEGFGVMSKRLLAEFEVTETFFALSVASMERAIEFYSEALGAVVTWTSPGWSSLQIAGVRVGLFAVPSNPGGRVGLHFSVTSLEAACASILRAGGQIVSSPEQVASEVVIAEVSGSEGNIFVLRKG